MIRIVFAESIQMHFTPLYQMLKGVVILSGSGSSALQVPPDSCRLPALVHDFSLDLLSGDDGEEHGLWERGETEGDREDHGPESCHLLAELGSVLWAVVGPHRPPPLFNPEGDFHMTWKRFKEDLVLILENLGHQASWC